MRSRGSIGGKQVNQHLADPHLEGRNIACARVIAGAQLSNVKYLVDHVHLKHLFVCLCVDHAAANSAGPPLVPVCSVYFRSQQSVCIHIKPGTFLLP
jgi:hypothetical protein